MLKMYGIPNCGTVKKARTWLEEHKIDYEFHDYKKQGVPAGELDGWIKQLGWEPLVNRQGMTWRRLSDEEKKTVVDAASAKALMQASSSVIKRPLLMRGKKAVALGFNEGEWSRLFTAK